MGQRHQLFVIARIGARYRSLAAVHRQWLYGASALEACMRLLKVFREPGNLKLLQLELARAASLPEDTWHKSMEWNETIPEFPFVTTCLMFGAAVDFSTGAISNVTDEPWNMSFNAGDNNDGITVLDITDPQDTRYCFVHWQSDSLEAGLNMVPLNGEEYVSLYNGAEVPELLRKTPLIPMEALRQAWPEGEWCTRQERGLPTAQMPDPSSEPREVSSLAGVAMEMSIERLLDEDDPLQQGIEELPTFQPSLKKYMSRHPEVITRPFGFDMLQRALLGADELDLHRYPSLSGDQILTLIEGASEVIKSLDISFNHQFTLNHLYRIPSTHVIQHLFVWDNEKLPYEDLQANSQIKTVFHRQVFLGAYEEYAKYSSSAKTRMLEAFRSKKFWFEHDPPPGHPNLASQLIYVGVGQPWAPADPNLGHHVPLFDSEAYHGLSGPQLRDDFFPVVAPLHDVQNSPEALLCSVYWMLRALPMGNDDPMRMASVGPLMLSWAMALRQHESQYQCRGLPPKLYTNARAAYHTRSVHFGYPHITVQPGKWNPLIVQEKFFTRTCRIRVAFLTAAEDGQLRVCNANTFMEETGAGAFKDKWTQLTSGIKGVYHTGEPQHLGNWTVPSRETAVGDDVEVVPCDEGTVRNLMALMEKVHGP